MLHTFQNLKINLSKLFIVSDAEKGLPGNTGFGWHVFLYNISLKDPIILKEEFALPGDAHKLHTMDGKSLEDPENKQRLLDGKLKYDDLKEFNEFKTDVENLQLAWAESCQD